MHHDWCPVSWSKPGAILGMVHLLNEVVYSRPEETFSAAG